MSRINIVIPSHQRFNILVQTVNFYLAFYPRSKIIIVDSSGLKESLFDGLAHRDRICVVQSELGNPHAKLQLAEPYLDETPILVASNDDLYCYREEAIRDVLSGETAYSHPRWLMIQDTKSPNLLRLWEGWTSFDAAAQCGKFERLKKFSPEGMNVFYGLYGRSAFGKMSKIQFEAAQLLAGDRWSVLENFTNICALGLDWGKQSGGYCFRKLDRKYSSNLQWRPSWVAFESIVNQPALANQIATLIREFLFQFISVDFSNHDAIDFLTQNIEAYKSARSRAWHRGHDYVFSRDHMSFGQCRVLDGERHGFVFSHGVKRQSSALFDGEWISDHFAVNSLNASSSSYFFEEKDYQMNL
jgi:hypothetical protein